MTPTTRRSRVVTALAVLALGATATACSSDTADDAPTTSADASWPRTVDTENGPITLDHEPQRIVSTSVTLTGSLLSLDAPLVGTGAQQPSSATDENGLFSQWADIAHDRDVDVLYQGTPSVEKITAATPDLIVVSASGADSTADQYDTLSKIAPTLVLDYTDRSWQEMASVLADAIGAEERADELIAEFDATVDTARTAIAPAVASGAASANVLTYNSPQDSRIFTAASAQGQLVERLGLTLATLPEDMTTADKGTMAGRADVVPVGQENLSRALPGDVTFVVNAEQAGADKLTADPTLTNTASVQGKRVYALGFDSFRLDWYSANNVVDRIVDALT